MRPASLALSPSFPFPRPSPSRYRHPCALSPIVAVYPKRVSPRARAADASSLSLGNSYWEKHLQGRPYHISALYVIDLDRFRQIAAGDRLRQQYQALSADPNSLANLDQDLPNQLWRDIPIVRCSSSLACTHLFMS